MRYAQAGGLWLHRFTLQGEPMAHLVSVDREALVRAGQKLGLKPSWLQYRPLKDVATGSRVDAWHWDLLRDRLRRAVELAGERIPLSQGRRTGPS